MSPKRKAARQRWLRQPGVWRRPSPSAAPKASSDRSWIFLLSTVVLHAGVFVIPRSEAARLAPRPPIVVERVQAKAAPTAPEPLPVPAPPPAKRAPVARRAKVIEAPVVAPPAPKKIVGLSLSATVDGDGPAFRLGETSRGVTEVRPIPATPPAPSRASFDGVAAPTLELPRRLRAVEPIYPEEYRGLRVEGQVTIALRIDPDGSIGDVELVAPSPHEAFNRSAVATARREQFRPAIKDGVPIAHTIRCTYHFRLST